MECIQEHHPYETEKMSGSRAWGIIDRMCMRWSKIVRTVDEHPKFREKEDDEIYAERERDAHVRHSLGVPWILEPGSPVSVPLNDTRPIQYGLDENQTGRCQTTPRTRWRDRESRLTLATTARTMGPKTMFMFISMLVMSLDNQSRRAR